MGTQAGARILIVDDDANLRQAMAEALREEGYRVFPLPPELAVETARLLQPDLILLDVLMPDTDGRHLCRRLRSESRTRTIPIALVTGVPAFLLEPFRAYGGDWGYLQKPFTLDELLAAVREQLGAPAASIA
jgi:DNA-binding response OmpR family regulator